MITQLEEIAQNAWPGLRQIIDDGWVLRFAEGYTRRANSVSPLYAGADNVEEKIARCEALYRHTGLPAIFKMFPAAAPTQLDELLAARGYAMQAMTSVQLLSLDTLTLPAPTSVWVYTELTPVWLEAYRQLSTLAAKQHDLHCRILAQSCLPKYLALAMVGEEPVACGLAVLERQYTGLFDIITHPAHRRRGYAGQVIAALLHHARAQGAAQAYLQVMADNPPALQLYAKLGFHHQYSYWYRVL